MKVRSTAASNKQRPSLAWAVVAIAAALTGTLAHAQNYPVTPGQRSTAQQVAQAGVPLEDLAPNAPDRYTVKRGDTLWDISGLFLRTPWRWPELWGMNLQQVRNPHLIYPGQQLVLDKRDGRATLRFAGEGGVPTVRLSPRVRAEPLDASALPMLKPHLIEPFLAEPIIVGEGELERAPRIVAAPDARVLLTRGDRAYVRGPASAPLADGAAAEATEFRVFRSATPLRDPVTRQVLGYEAQYVGRANLVKGETIEQVRTSSGDSQPVPVPGTVEILAAREEMRVGDRLLPEPPRQIVSYAPRAPQATVVDGAIVSIYGNAVGMAAQNQIVVINKGTADGIESGHVLALLKSGGQVQDRTQGKPERIKLPDERNGLLMVFRPFERLSYALVLESSDGAKVGDRIANPR